MDSMPNPKQTDPEDVAIAAIKEAYQQIGRADKLRPNVNEQVSRLEQDAARHPSDQQSHPSDQQKRLAVARRQSSGGKLVLRGLIALLMATCIGAGAIALRSHSDAAKLMIASWGPQFDLISSPAAENPIPTQPSPPAVHASAAKAEAPRSAPPQPTPAAQTAPEDAAPTFATPSPTQAQPLQSMASDLAAVEQEIGQLQASIEQLKAGIEQLKTSQEQMVRDNRELAGQLKAAQAQMARDQEYAAEQLKAGQEQLVRLIAKPSEQNLQPKPALPPRPIAAPTRKPVPKLSSPQAGARPLAPTQGRPGQQLSSVPR